MDFEIKSSKSKEELLEIISENTNQICKGEIFGSKYFSGKIEDNTFKIWRTFKGTSLSTILVGCVEGNDNGALVKIDCKYRIIDRIFLFVWWTFTIIACIILPFLEHSPDIPIYSPYIMLIIGVIIIIIYKCDFSTAVTKLEEMIT